MYPLLYTGASGLVAGERTLDTVANNLANSGTTAYSPERPLFATYLDDALTRAVGRRPVAPAGVSVAGAWHDDSPGPLRPTGNGLDLALQGKGWFRVKTPAGERLTRAGEFRRASDGNLVTTKGYQVLDDSGQPINLPQGQVAVAEDGSISVNGARIGKLAVATADPSQMQRDGEGLWRSATPAAPLDPAEVKVASGFLEGSKVEATTELIEMISAQRNFEMQQKVVDLAANQLARRSLELAGVR